MEWGGGPTLLAVLIAMAMPPVVGMSLISNAASTLREGLDPRQDAKEREKRGGRPPSRGRTA